MNMKTMREASSLDTTAPWLNFVRAERVVRFGTPLQTVMVLAGDHQQAQSDVHTLPISGFLKLLLNTDTTLTLDKRLALAIQMSGWPRPNKLV